MLIIIRCNLFFYYYGMSVDYNAEILNTKDLEISREFENTQKSLSELTRDVEQSVSESDEVDILKKYDIVWDDDVEKIWKKEAEQWLKIIRTNYPSNTEEMPSDLQDLVKYLEAIARWTDDWNDNDYITLSELTPQENAEMNKLVNLSKTPNKINYLENPTYKKYLNIIERELKLPRYALESICDVESGWYLYENGRIKWSSAGAQWLFQFMPDTSNIYMKNSIVTQKSKKVFKSKDEFLRDPLATAWAAWVIINIFMYDKKYGYDFQSSLACYNCGPRNYEKKFGARNLTVDDLPRLPKETRNYVREVTKKVLDKNSLPSTDDSDIFAGIKCMWNSETASWSSLA